MKSPRKEAKCCLLQAQNDLEFARLAVREKFFAQTCFISQQTGEKVLKALAYGLGELLVLTHSLFELIKQLETHYPQLNEFSERAGILDQYYVPTRYPNGLQDGVPFEVFNHWIPV